MNRLQRIDALKRAARFKSRQDQRGQHSRGGWKRAILGLFTGVLLAGSAVAQDNTVVFGTEDAGVNKAIPEWGVDTAYPSYDYARRSVIYMGTNEVDTIRVAFPVDDAVTGSGASATLSAANQAEADTRIDIMNWAGIGNKPIQMTTDTGNGVGTWYKSGSEVIPGNWVAAMDATVNYYNSQGKTMISAAPFNEPDYGWNQGTMQNLYDICVLLQADPRFSGINLAGGSTLSCGDVGNETAFNWYDYIKTVIEEGTTHQLAGDFNHYADFYTYVKANGDKAVNEEIHNIVEVIVGAEYGPLDTGIYWGTAERVRAGIIKACQGDRLGYAENRPNWTAAAVYRAPGAVKNVQAFVGESERQCSPTTYRFISKDRPVFYDGNGPQRIYDAPTTTGGGAYADTSHRNVDQMINITWGDDVQPAINGTYYVVNRNSGKVMEVAGGSNVDGTDIQQNAYAGVNYQQWNITPFFPSIANGRWGDASYYKVTNVKSGSACDMDTSAWQTEYGYGDGADVHQWSGGNNDNQQWYFEYVEEGWFKIRNRWSNKCLSVDGASTANGATLLQWTDGGSDYSQQWRLVPVTANPTDLTAPSQVTGVSATANSASVQLNWNASAASDLDGYTVMRSTTSGGPYEIIARGLTSTSFLDSLASRNTTYYYVVKAVDKSLNRSVNSTQVSATPAGTALVAHYAFEGDATDSTANGNDGALGGAGYIPGGLDSSCLLLDGGYASLPAEVANHEAVTIAAWVYWSGGAAWQRIFDFGNGTSESLYLTPDNGYSSMEFNIFSNGVDNKLYTSTLPLGEWVHVAVTLSGTTANLYINGTSVASASTLSLKASDLNPALNYIGKSQFNDPSFSGAIDDFRIYNYALSGPEVASLAAATPAPPVGAPPVQSSTTEITLTNPGFELPDAGQLLTFDADTGDAVDVPGWFDINGGNGWNDGSGVELQPHYGTYAGVFKAEAIFGSDIWQGGAYQLTGYTIQDGDVFTIGYWAKSTWDASLARAILLYGNTYNAANTIGQSSSTALTSTYQYFEADIPATPASVGQQLVIRLMNPSGIQNSWAAIDDVTLIVSNTNAVPDTTPPAAPTGLGATAGAGSVSLNWADNTEPDLARYTVYRSTTSGSGYVAIASGLGTSDYVDNTVANGTTYYYVVTATDTSSNESGNSTEASATPQQNPPTTPSFLSASVVSDTQIDLMWGGSTGADSYNVKRSGVSGGPYTTIASGVVPTSYSDTGLTASTTYYYVVSAVNAGGESSDSVQVSATTQDPPDTTPPAAPTGLGATAGDGSVSLDWADNAEPDLSSYTVYRSTTSGSGYAVIASGLAVSAYVDNTAANGTTYYYVVTATDTSSNESANSAEASATPQVSAPAAPTGLGATATSDTQISLSWTASAGAASYNVKRASSTGGPYTTIATGVATTSYGDTGLTASTAYYYVVSAVNAGGESANSAEASATTQATPDTTPPAAPTGLGAVAGDGSVSLDWADNTEPDLASYTVYRSTTSGSGYVSIASGLAVSAYTDNTAANGTTYYYVVTATDASSNESGNSAETSATPQVSAPAAPTGLGATATSDTQISLSWTASAGAASYTVKRSSTIGGPYTTIASGVATTSYGDTGLTASTTYYYVVSAVNAGGESADSAEASATTQAAPDTTPPAAPTGLGATAGDGSVSLDWADNTEPDLASYTVYRSTTSGSGYASIASGLAVSAYTDNTAVNGTTYYYVVTAIDTSSNESANSAEASATPADTTPPAAPTGLGATAGDSSVSLDWADNGEPDLASYTVYRSTTSGSGYSVIASGLAVSAYTDNTAANGTTYYYVVTATDSASNESSLSAEVSATPQAAPSESILESNASGNGKVVIKSDQAGAQSFSHGSSGTYSVTKIVLELSRKNGGNLNGANLTVSLGTSVNGGTVAGSSVDLPIASITNTSGGNSFQTVTIDLPSAVTLNAGQTYYINLSSNFGKEVFLRYNTSSSYANGTYYLKGQNDGGDAWFELWGN